MLRRAVALVVAFIAAFFALPAADASPPDATKQSLVCVYASPAHDLPINHTAPDRGPSAQRAEAVVSTGQRAADRASHGVLVRPDAPGTCGHTTYDSTAQLVQVDNPGTTTPQHVGTLAGDLASLQRTHIATKTERAIVNGETAATRYGREMHATWNYGPGFQREFRLPNGRRVDGINLQTRQVVELKPNNPRAIRLGQRQLDDYLAELNDLYPGNTPWTGSIQTYTRP